MNLVLTIAMGDAYEQMAKLTHPSIKAYAEKIGAEFKCIDKQEISQTTPHWEKFQIYHLLNKYERILYLDTDIIIRDDCPNLFDIVPKDRLGAFDEAPFTNRSKELMIDILKAYGEQLPNWNGKYYNSGVLVISRKHKQLFRKPDKEVFSFYEQSYLNMQIALQGIDMFGLSHRHNRMTCMDAATGEERFASYIIHYAGYPDLRLVLDLIPRDLAKWKEAKGNYKYQRHIYVSVVGGLGDQMNAEPAIRYMAKNVYPDADIRIATHWPRLFEHLDLPICEHGKADLPPDTPYYLMSSLPGPETPTWAVISNLLCHTVDYCSIALLRRILPEKDKRVQLSYSLEDVSDLVDIVGVTDLNDLVVIHAGRHWQSKTFPVVWWQDVVDGLAQNGVPVCLIGEDDETRGTVAVKCPEKAIDLRNLLSLGSLIALLSSANILISNDSAPIHLAGAFDNWIVLIPTCKHPDHVLPIRNGNAAGKNIVFSKKLTLDDLDSQPTLVYGTTAEKIKGDWKTYLPDPASVVMEVTKIHEQ